MLQFHATPYDMSKTGFYFDDIDDYQTKYDAAYERSGTEEYEIQFIDGTTAEAELFRVGQVDQSNIDKYLQMLDELDDHQLPGGVRHHG